ncbi:unnamed protein product [Adineta ricciae]|uniref:Uncharacterized protein n=1 Tax=Adineta ricciae TaxID=249248 RepID=A0A815FLP5_ADIRI|nr:unnamed protein product [Adineta ricciae]
MAVRSLHEKSIRVRRITRKTLIKAKTRQNTKKSSRSARSLITSDLLKQNTRVIHILPTEKATLSAKKNKVKQNHSRTKIHDQAQISNESKQNHANQSRRKRTDHPEQSHNINDENLALPNLPSEKSTLNHTHRAVPSLTAAFQFNQKKNQPALSSPTKTSLSTRIKCSKKPSVYPIIEHPEEPLKKKKKKKHIAPWKILLCSILSCLLLSGIILAIVIPLITRKNGAQGSVANSTSVCTASNHTTCSTTIYAVSNSGFGSIPYWTFVSCCYIVPTVNQFTIDFISQADDGYWSIDDVSATQGNGERISNGDFENGITNWTVIVSPNGTSSTTVDSSSNNQHNGMSYLYAASINAPDHVKQTFTIIPGENVLISFWWQYTVMLGSGGGTNDLTVTLT